RDWSSDVCSSDLAFAPGSDCRQIELITWRNEAGSTQHMPGHNKNRRCHGGISDKFPTRPASRILTGIFHMILNWVRKSMLKLSDYFPIRKNYSTDPTPVGSVLSRRPAGPTAARARAHSGRWPA